MFCKPRRVCVSGDQDAADDHHHLLPVLGSQTHPRSPQGLPLGAAAHAHRVQRHGRLRSIPLDRHFIGPVVSRSVQLALNVAISCVAVGTQPAAVSAERRQPSHLRLHVAQLPSQHARRSRAPLPHLLSTRVAQEPLHRSGDSTAEHGVLHPRDAHAAQQQQLLGLKRSATKWREWVATSFNMVCAGVKMLRVQCRRGRTREGVPLIELVLQ